MTQTENAPHPCGPWDIAAVRAAGAPVSIRLITAASCEAIAAGSSWEAVDLLPRTVNLVGGSAVLTRDHLSAGLDDPLRVCRSTLERPGSTGPDVVMLIGLQEESGTLLLEAAPGCSTAAAGSDGAGPADRQRGAGPGESCATWPAAALVGRLRAAGHEAALAEGAGDDLSGALLPALSDIASSDQPAGGSPLLGVVRLPAAGTAPASMTVAALRDLVVELADLVRRRRACEAGLGRLAVPRGGRVLRVGLTGGIGSGKSTAARMLKARGAHVVDADLIAREVVAPGTTGLTEIVAEFGRDILTAGGTLDRAVLAERVFADARARGILEAITLPRVARRAAERMEAAEPGGVAVYDVPLLVEGGMENLFDCVVVIEAPMEARLARLEGRGLSRSEAEHRMASQADDDDRRCVADVVLLNNGTEQDLADGIDWLWEHRLVADDA